MFMTNKKIVLFVLGSVLSLSLLPTYGVDAISSASQKSKPVVEPSEPQNESQSEVKIPVEDRNTEKLNTEKPLATHYKDGVYKGAYEDETTHIKLTFTLKNQKIRKIYIQSWTVDDVDYLSTKKNTKGYEIFKQYKGLIGFVYGRSIEDIKRVREPETIIKDATFNGESLKANVLEGKAFWLAIVNALENGTVEA